ncbi:MAG: MBL fold metallo-hydrolase [Bacteroidales bacterium]|nr:MBL fold metallo-hydrolase [Bacteroidales bacterium]
MKFLCLGSGSCGNCYYLESGGTALLIDLGIGIRAFKKHAKDYGLRLPDIQAILVTHDHTDHVKAVGPLSIERHLPVYASEGVHVGIQRNRFMTKKIPEHLKRITTLDTPFEIGPFRITPFQVVHDSNDNNGYFIEVTKPEPQEDLFDSAAALGAADAGKEPLTLCLITDCGEFTDNLVPYVQRARYLIMEANYDSAMLATGPYPVYLKKRIMGGRGHLDNAICADRLQQFLTPTTRHIWLCHLSEENNHPEIARKTVQTALDDLPFEPKPQLEVLRRRVPSGIVTLK